MLIQLLPGADWLLPAGTDCTACSGSQVRHLTLRSKILTLIEALNTYNEQQTDDDDFQTAYKALFFARCMEGIKNDLTTHLANLEKRDFEELLSPDFFQIMREVQWLKDTRLEAELLAMKDEPLEAFGIDEEVEPDQDCCRPLSLDGAEHQGDKLAVQSHQEDNRQAAAGELCGCL